MAMKFNEQRLTDVTAEAAKVEARRDEVAKRLWDMSASNRDAAPTDEEARSHAELVTEHSFLSRRHESLVSEIERLELLRPADKPGKLQSSPMARWSTGGTAELSAEERQAHVWNFGTESLPTGIDSHEVAGMRLPPGAAGGQAFLLHYNDLIPRAVGPGLRPDEATGGDQWRPTEVYPEVGQRLLAFGGLERGCSTWNTPNGVTVNVPTADDTANEGEIFATTAGPITEQEVAVGNREMKSSVGSSKKMNMSIFMEADTPIDVDRMIRAFAFRRLGRAWATQFMSGDGSGDRPRGALTDATLGKAFAGEQGPTTVELIDLADSIDVGYMEGESDPMGLAPPGGGHMGFVMHQKELREIRKLRGTDGHFIWLPSLVGGDPGSILGYPYIIDNKTPAPPDAADALQQKVILFGSFGNYLIRNARTAMLVRFFDSGTLDTMSYTYVAFNRRWGRYIGGFTGLGQDTVECVKYGETVA